MEDELDFGEAARVEVGGAEAEVEACRGVISDEEDEELSAWIAGNLTITSEDEELGGGEETDVELDEGGLVAEFQLEVSVLFEG